MKKLALAVALSLSAAPAYAQVAAGGAGGAFTSVYQYFITNIWAGMALLAVVAIGCMILFGRFAWYVIAGVIGGGLVIKYAADIAALIT